MQKLIKSLLGLNEPTEEKQGICWLMKLMFTEIGSLCLLNVVFLISCIPIITIIPAWGALTSVTMQMLEGCALQPIRKYWKELRENFRVFLLSEILLGLAFIVLGVALAFYWRISQGNAYLFPLFIIISVLAMGAMLGTAYLFPVMTGTNASLKNAAWNSLMLCLACPHHSIPAAAVSAAILLLSLMFFPISLPLVLLLVFSIANMIISYAAWNDINRFVIREHDM